MHTSMNMITCCSPLCPPQHLVRCSLLVGQQRRPFALRYAFRERGFTGTSPRATGILLAESSANDTSRALLSPPPLGEAQPSRVGWCPRLS